MYLGSCPVLPNPLNAGWSKLGAIKYQIDSIKPLGYHIRWDSHHGNRQSFIYLFFSFGAICMNFRIATRGPLPADPNTKACPAQRSAIPVRTLRYTYSTV